MTLRPLLLRYHWLKFLRLQEDPRKLAWGMALGVFIGITPTIPFHMVAALSLAALFRVSPVTAFIGIQIGNPLTIPPIYLAAYKVGQFLLYRGKPLVFPDTFLYKAWMRVLWQGGVALQVGGVIIAIPPAIASYFLTLWIVQRYHRRKSGKGSPVSSTSPKTLLKRLGLRPKKALGQHFLLHPHQARRIVAALEPAGEDTVVEIGAGLGALTGFLAAGRPPGDRPGTGPGTGPVSAGRAFGRDPRGRGRLSGCAASSISRGWPGGGPAPGGGGEPALPDHLTAAVHLIGTSRPSPRPCS